MATNLCIEYLTALNSIKHITYCQSMSNPLPNSRRKPLSSKRNVSASSGPAKETMIYINF